ncbi:MAG: hypothetical protein RLZZ360_183 [Candidatus Parcubacteria bacterium]|jgi:histidine triad (HIT) family protein
MSNPDDFDFYCDVALKQDADIEKVFESDRILAYYHTKPFWEKHIVIIPKEHIWDIRHVTDTSLYEEILTVARDIIRTIPEEELQNKGVQLLTNIGKWQDTPHLHFHIAIGDKIK